MAVRLTRDAFANEDITGAARELALFAKTARNAAISEHRPYEIVCDETAFSLQAVPGTGVAASAPSGAAPLSSMERRLPTRITMQIFPWGGDRWTKAKGFVWTFSPGGLCAPHRFRFARQEGAAWFEESFNALTADRQDEAFYLP